MPRVQKNTASRPAPPAASTDHVGAHPTYEAVEQRAYELFLARGGTHGHDWNDWFAAERQLLGPPRNAARRAVSTAHDS
jgi:hypothetical protein